jgi:DNA-binding beta-propeller fold protein YncE
MRIEENKGRIVALAAVLTLGIFCLSGIERPATGSDPDVGSARLVSVEQLPDYSELCAPEEASAIATLSAEFEENSWLGAFKEKSVYAADTIDVTRPAVRAIYDTYPIYSSVAVDPVRDEVVLQDTNLFGIRIFNRLDNTPPNVAATQPKRVIEGSDTKNEYNNGLYVDPKNGDIYNVAMDTADSVFVFRGGASGNTEPQRILRVPHRGFQLAVDEEKQELYSTNQYPPRVLAFRKSASGDEKPLRVIEGPRTGLADVHGIAIDVQRKLMFVGNWGNASDYTVAGTGKFNLPSIRVYPLDANGDVAPLRVIQGPKTQLNWMGGISLDPESGNLWVANDVGNSVLVFKGTDNGDVAPRIIKGNKTGFDHPAGIFVDTKNKEVWVSNMGNSSATAYSITANGDAAPIRTIRSAPIGRRSLKFGKPQAVAYDTKRDELLVPN